MYATTVGRGSFRGCVHHRAEISQELPRGAGPGFSHDLCNPPYCMELVAAACMFNGLGCLAPDVCIGDSYHMRRLEVGGKGHFPVVVVVSFEFFR